MTAIDYDALETRLGKIADGRLAVQDQATVAAISLAAIRALRAALQDAEVGELKNALAVGQACIELQEERNLNQRAYIEMAELRAALAESERDAGRYRFLMGCFYRSGNTLRISIVSDMENALFTDEKLNEAIDAAIAMAAQEKANG